jgi:hypothetical protein
MGGLSFCVCRYFLCCDRSTAQWDFSTAAAPEKIRLGLSQQAVGEEPDPLLRSPVELAIRAKSVCSSPRLFLGKPNAEPGDLIIGDEQNAGFFERRFDSHYCGYIAEVLFIELA